MNTLSVSSWVLVDESVEGLAGFQEPILPPLKPSKTKKLISSYHLGWLWAAA